VAPAAPAKATPRGRRLVKWLLVASVVAGLMYACRGEKTHHWQEEVVASSGERLLLERSVRLERIGAPFNPFKSEWAWRESTIVVRDGPADVKGARYEARLLPMLIERDPSTKQWIVVGISVYCDDRVPFNPVPGQRYFAFVLARAQPMQQVRLPEWAWERRLNLLMPNENKSPPRHVTPDFADRFNREESRGEIQYFEIRRSAKSNC
jgi:hypothetical protein